MLFHSVPFILFFLVFLGILIVIPPKGRLPLTLIGSYIFYSFWNPSYIVVLLGLSLCGFFMGLFVKSASRLGFALMLIVIFAPLAAFKYTAFFLNNISELLGRPASYDFHLSLPLGISFITFTIVAYLTDIRRNIISPERNLTRFSVFISFFPHLIAGPIMRARELLPQFTHLSYKHKFLKLGIFLYAIGMIKKVVFADQIGGMVNSFYNVDSPQNLYNSLFALYGYSIQIYCDFSGYMDMAYGLSFILGIRLPLNFNRPYLAHSIRNFWQRWHITLSNWLRDYLYIPLGGSRRGFARTLINVTITMLLGGLWHGASWNFIIWGALHAFYINTERLQEKYFPQLKFPRWVGVFVTFHLVSFAWVLFRAHNLAEAQHILAGFQYAGNIQSFLLATAFPLILMIVALGLHRFDRISYVIWMIKKIPARFIYALSLGLILIGLVFSVGSPNDFIYYDF